MTLALKFPLNLKKFHSKSFWSQLPISPLVFSHEKIKNAHSAFDYRAHSKSIL